MLQRRNQTENSQQAVAPPSFNSSQVTSLYRNVTDGNNTSIGDLCEQPGFQDLPPCSAARVISISGTILLVLVMATVGCMLCCIARSAFCSPPSAERPDRQRSNHLIPRIQRTYRPPTQPMPRPRQVKVWEKLDSSSH